MISWAAVNFLPSSRTVTARAHPLCDGLDRAALAGAVAPLEEDADRIRFTRLRCGGRDRGGKRCHRYEPISQLLLKLPLIARVVPFAGRE